MVLYGVLITYNDASSIKTAIESIYDKVNAIIAVDGRFKDFPQIGGLDYSTDGTLEYLRSIDKVSLIMQTGLSEVDKRNLYLVGSQDDWYVHLDADEEWLGDIDIPKEADMQIAWMQRPTPRHFLKRIRLFRHVPGLHYENKHYWLKDKNGHTFALLDKPGNKYKAETLQTVKLYHDEESRNVERVSAKRRYYKVLSKFENRIRESME